MYCIRSKEAIDSCLYLWRLKVYCAKRQEYSKIAYTTEQCTVHNDVFNNMQQKYYTVYSRVKHINGRVLDKSVRILLVLKRMIYLLACYLILLKCQFYVKKLLVIYVIFTDVHVYCVHRSVINMCTQTVYTCYRKQYISLSVLSTVYSIHKAECTVYTSRVYSIHTIECTVYTK